MHDCFNYSSFKIQRKVVRVHSSMYIFFEYSFFTFGLAIIVRQNGKIIKIKTPFFALFIVASTGMLMSW